MILRPLSTSLAVLLSILLLLPSPTSAQFGNVFEQLFQQHPGQGGGGGGGGERSHAAIYKQHADGVSCPHYLCPRTLDCVKKPTQCPCPEPEDIKCAVPGEGGGTVVCVRGSTGCEKVGEALKLQKGRA